MISTDAKAFFRTRVRTILAALGAIVVLSLVGWFVVPPVDRFLTGGPVVRSLRRDAERTLPIGSSRQDVEAWFRRHRIQFDTTVDHDRGLINLWACFSDSDWLNPGIIDIEVSFDERQRLRRILIERQDLWY